VAHEIAVMSGGGSFAAGSQRVSIRDPGFATGIRRRDSRQDSESTADSLFGANAPLARGLK
jgi:hypothetical protein